MRFLYLHIGHHKTGSTALQAAFSASRDVLGERDILYPSSGDDARQADLDRRVPTGNGRDFLRGRVAMRRHLADASDKRSHVLFSSELMFDVLASTKDFSFLTEEAEAAGFTGVRILLFIRDPLPHAVSVWQQRVKGWQGETSDLDDWLTESYCGPEQVLHVLRGLGTLSRVEVTIRNYDRRRDHLAEEAEHWLGLSPRELVRPSVTQINRSLTRGEAALQRLLNLRLGPSGKHFAFRLVHRLPELPPDLPRPSVEAQNRVLARLRPALEEVNRSVDDAHHYREERIRELPAGTSFNFTEAQLNIIAEGFAESIEPPKTGASQAPRWQRGVRRIIGGLRRCWQRVSKRREP